MKGKSQADGRTITSALGRQYSFPVATQLDSQYLFYCPRKGRRPSRRGWIVTYRDLPARRIDTQ